jgi:hypothetical protein
MMALQGSPARRIALLNFVSISGEQHNNVLTSRIDMTDKVGPFLGNL